MLFFTDEQRIPETCRERFLPLAEPTLRVLHSAGLILGGLSDLCGGYLAQRPERRNYHIVLVSVAGHGVIEYGDGSRTVIGPHDVFVSPNEAPGHRHYPLEDHWIVAWFRILANEHWTDLSSRTNDVRAGARVQAIVDAVERLLHEYFNERSDSERLVELYSEVLLIELKREVLTAQSPANEAIHQQLNQLWNEINAHLRQNWKIESMLTHVGLSRTQLFRYCKAIYGVTPYDKVRQLRLNRASSLLVHSDYPIGAIAEMVGYQSIYSFSAAFKEEFSCPPRAYRKSYRSSGPDAPG